MNVRVIKQTTANKSALMFLDRFSVIVVKDTSLVLMDTAVKVRRFCTNNCDEFITTISDGNGSS